MHVFVNGRDVVLLPGMTVKHALIAAGLWTHIARLGQKVYDEWSHEVGLGGELKDGMKIFVR